MKCFATINATLSKIYSEKKSVYVCVRGGGGGGGEGEDAHVTEYISHETRFQCPFFYSGCRKPKL